MNKDNKELCSYLLNQVKEKLRDVGAQEEMLGLPLNEDMLLVLILAVLNNTYYPLRNNINISLVLQEVLDSTYDYLDNHPLLRMGLKQLYHADSSLLKECNTYFKVESIYGIIIQVLADTDIKAHKTKIDAVLTSLASGASDTNLFTADIEDSYGYLMLTSLETVVYKTSKTPIVSENVDFILDQSCDVSLRCKGKFSLGTQTNFYSIEETGKSLCKTTSAYIYDGFNLCVYLDAQSPIHMIFLNYTDEIKRFRVYDSSNICICCLDLTTPGKTLCFDVKTQQCLEL